MRVYGCTQEQNGSPYLSFIVRQYVQMADDRKVVEIKKFSSMVTYYIVLFIPFGKQPVLVFNANTNNERLFGTGCVNNVNYVTRFSLKKSPRRQEG